ncbi:hypothetical protein GCM10010174_25930 [Kutzneria viridogrisea]|uniref:DUF2267 domain-containing protein n=1 Tax=Kutzneria viridogrisea TaxID=47990 RepID=A0ABR6BRH8_9PSEU|nr:hypothetical protein [Kutzneria viridogrisea]
MALLVSDANDISRLLHHLMRTAETAPAEDQVWQAALRLAERVNRQLGAGVRPEQLAERRASLNPTAPAVQVVLGQHPDTRVLALAVFLHGRLVEPVLTNLAPQLPYEVCQLLPVAGAAPQQAMTADALSSLWSTTQGDRNEDGTQ